MLPKRKMTVRSALGDGHAQSSLKTKSAPKERKFGDFRLDFLKTCRHDLSTTESQISCPLCKLANVVSVSIFEAEAAERKKAYEESCRNRATLRLSLLRTWSRFQVMYYQDLESRNCLQIFLSRSFLDLLISHGGLGESHFNHPLEFETLIKLLERKNRIRDIGYLAALYLQARIRKYLTKRKVRLMLLQRFEYVPATKYKGEFFVDTMKLKKMNRYPRLLRDERPGSPRTIQRRLLFEVREREKRRQQLHTLASKHGAGTSGEDMHHTSMLLANSENIFDKENKLITFLKELLVVRDVVSVTMGALKLRQHLGSHDEFSVWFCLSAPSISTRQLGMSLALSQLTSPRLSLDVSLAKERDNNSSAISGVNAVNRALQTLEQAAMDALICQSCEDVVRHLLNPELYSVYTSVLNISQDDLGIWNANISHTNNPTSNSNCDSKIDPTYSTTPRSSDNNSTCEVMPLSLYLRPFNPAKNPSNIFRVFFYAEEMVAISAYSPYVFYPEVYKNRDQILLAIRKFVTQAAFKTQVRDYYKVASRGARPTTNSSSNSVSSGVIGGSTSGGMQKRSSTRVDASAQR
ncbi:hypothetical protein EON65_50690 [archaeon]|nr:MAG: hypothetical protein EON65_50690 [archaeon]